MRRYLVIGMFAVGSVLRVATVRAEDPAAAFQGFCDNWMHGLEQRAQGNAAQIKWEAGPEGVLGTYVGYAPEHTCTTKTGTKSVVVGKIDYREVVYEKHGPSISDAEHSAPRVREATEVTEIFRYSGGKWIY
jgi:hypothetical protein